MSSIRPSLLASGLLHAVAIGGVGYFAASAAGSGRVLTEVRVQIEAEPDTIEPPRAEEARVLVEARLESPPVEEPRLPEEWLDPRLFEPAPRACTEELPPPQRPEVWLARVLPAKVLPTPEHAFPSPPSVPAQPAPATPVVEVMPGENPPPDYPWVARRRGLAGVVAVSVVVDAAGAVVSANVVRTSQHDVLDAAALGAVRRWRFRHGPGTTVVEVEFALRER